MLNTVSHQENTTQNLVRYCFIPTGMAIIKKTQEQILARIQRDRDPYTLLVGM